jgi:hypothetical protein
VSAADTASTNLLRECVSNKGMRPRLPSTRAGAAVVWPRWSAVKGVRHAGARWIPPGCGSRGLPRGRGRVGHRRAGTHFYHSAWSKTAHASGTFQGLCQTTPVDIPGGFWSPEAT